MDFGISADYEIEAGLDVALPPIRERIDATICTRTYGSAEPNVFLVVVCRDPQLNFKQRFRFSRKDWVIYADIMLDFNRVIRMGQKEKTAHIAVEIYKQCSEVVQKYKIPDFDTKRFLSDLFEVIDEFKL